MNKAVSLALGIMAYLACANSIPAHAEQAPKSAKSLLSGSVHSAVKSHSHSEQLFRDGLGAYQSRDYARAIRHWLPSARQGYANAQSSMGYLYYMGYGVAQSESKAYSWYTMAAAQGEATAQYYLGLMFLRGRVIKRNMATAYMWCDLAMKSGYPGSTRCRGAAARTLTDDEIERAEELGRRIVAGGQI